MQFTLPELLAKLRSGEDDHRTVAGPLSRSGSAGDDPMISRYHRGQRLIIMTAKTSPECGTGDARKHWSTFAHP